MTIDEARAEVHRIIEIVAALPEAQREKRYNEEIAKLPDNARALIAALVAANVVIRPSEHFMNSTKFWTFLAANWEKLATFASALVFLGCILILAVAIPNPTVFQEFAFRLVLTLAAGAFGGFIPGFLNIDIKWAKFALRAGGAMALSVLVYTQNPPALIRQSNVQPSPLVP